jgi:adenylylsulfate kinase-like enzyme
VKAKSGKLLNVVGFDIPWHEPLRPDFVLDAYLEESPACMAKRVMTAFHSRLILDELQIS